MFFEIDTPMTPEPGVGCRGMGIIGVIRGAMPILLMDKQIRRPGPLARGQPVREARESRCNAGFFPHTLFSLLLGRIAEGRKLGFEFGKLVRCKPLG